MEIKKFENSLIAFDFDNEIVNATDMAKRFNKRPIDFLRLDSTKAFIDAYNSSVSSQHSDVNQLVTTINGGKSPGTWMHRILAYKFASWLSPEFEVFAYKTFDEVINTRIKYLQIQNDRLWDKSDLNDTYGNMTEL